MSKTKSPPHLVAITHYLQDLPGTCPADLRGVLLFHLFSLSQHVGQGFHVLLTHYTDEGMSV